MMGIRIEITLILSLYANIIILATGKCLSSDYQLFRYETVSFPVGPQPVEIIFLRSRVLCSVFCLSHEMCDAIHLNATGRLKCSLWDTEVISQVEKTGDFVLYREVILHSFLHLLNTFRRTLKGMV
jgi:hypothetical protein